MQSISAPRLLRPSPAWPNAPNQYRHEPSCQEMSLVSAIAALLPTRWRRLARGTNHEPSAVPWSATARVSIRRLDCANMLEVGALMGILSHAAGQHDCRAASV